MSTPPLPPAPDARSAQEVSDSNVVSGIYINCFVGAVCLVCFCITQTWSRRLYRFRTWSEAVTFKPPDIAMTGWSKYVRWTVYVWRATDWDILMSCGVDAFIMIKLMLMGIQLFVPWSILSVAVLLPVNYSFTWLTDNANEVSSSALARLTLSAIPPGSPALWLPFAFVYLYTLYGCGLLYYHFVQFARLRLMYMNRGDDLAFYAEALKLKVEQRRAKAERKSGGAPSQPPSGGDALVAGEGAKDGPDVGSTADVGSNSEEAGKGVGLSGKGGDDTGGTAGKRTSADKGVSGDALGIAAGRRGVSAVQARYDGLVRAMHSVRNRMARIRELYDDARGRQNRDLLEVANQLTVYAGLTAPDQAPLPVVMSKRRASFPATMLDLPPPGAVNKSGKGDDKAGDQQQQHGAAHWREWARGKLHLNGREREGKIHEEEEEEKTVDDVAGDAEPATSSRSEEGGSGGSGVSLPPPPAADTIPCGVVELQPVPPDPQPTVNPVASVPVGAGEATPAHRRDTSVLSVAGSIEVGGDVEGRGGPPAAPSFASAHSAFMAAAAQRQWDAGDGAEEGQAAVQGSGSLAQAAGAAGQQVAPRDVSWSGAGRFTEIRADEEPLESEAPVMLLERPSARYQATVLVPAQPDWEAMLAQANPEIPSIKGGGTTEAEGAGARPGGSGQGASAGLSQAAVAARANEVSARPRDHHRRKFGVLDWDSLPWGDLEHTGEPHLRAVQVQRYACLITDVPVPPYVPPNPPRDPPPPPRPEDTADRSNNSPPRAPDESQDPAASDGRADEGTSTNTGMWLRKIGSRRLHESSRERGDTLDDGAVYGKAAAGLLPLAPARSTSTHLRSALWRHVLHVLRVVQKLAFPSYGLTSDLMDESLPATSDWRAQWTHNPFNYAKQRGKETALPLIAAEEEEGGGPTVARDVEVGSKAGGTVRAKTVPGGTELRVNSSRFIALTEEGHAPGALRRRQGLTKDDNSSTDIASSAPDLQTPRPASPTPTPTPVPFPELAAAGEGGGRNGVVPAASPAAAPARPRSRTPLPGGAASSAASSPALMQRPWVTPPRPSPSPAPSGKAASVASQAVARFRARRNWGIARREVFSGRVGLLPLSPAYDPVSAVFKSLFPHDFDRAIPVHNYRNVHLMLKLWSKHMIGLDSALEAYEQHGVRPWHCPCPRGCWKCYRVDSISYINKLVSVLQKNIISERAKTLQSNGRGTGCYVVLFKTQAAAALASAHPTALALNQGEFMVHPAPAPNNINWGVLLTPWAARRWWTWAMILPKIIVVLFPVSTFSAAAMQLDYVFCPSSIYPDGSTTPVPPPPGVPEPWSWPWYCEQDSFMAWVLKKFVIGWLPAVLLALWTSMFLPNAFHGLAQSARRHLSFTALDMDISNLYFLFNVFNVFLSGMLGASFMQQINRSLFQQGFSEFVKLVGVAVPASSNFFINYLSHLALAGFPGKLLIPHGGVGMYLLKRYLRLFRTFSLRERLFKLYSCRSPRYGPEIGKMMLVFVVGSAFAVISPLVPVMAAIYFILGYFTWKYLLLYIFVRKFESGGIFFHFVFERILWCFALLVTFTASVLAVKKAYIQFWIIIGTLPWFILWIGLRCRRVFGPMLGGNLPLEVAARAPRAEIDPLMYTHPALHPKALGWHPDVNLVWSGLFIWGWL